MTTTMLLNQFEAFAQKINHADPVRCGVRLKFAVKLGINLEVKRLQVAALWFLEVVNNGNRGRHITLTVGD